MGIAERREREKERLRTQIVEAARDIVSEQGLDALSMRSIAERIEYSPATIYLYFKDKDELLRSVVEEGFRRLVETWRTELESVGGKASARERYAAMGRAYALFALDNTAYFRVMFELPKTAQAECPEAGEAGEDGGEGGECTWAALVQVVQEGIDRGEFGVPDATRGAVIGWSLIHGLTSLCLSGHLRGVLSSRGEFLDLVEEAMASLYEGWCVREDAGSKGRAAAGRGSGETAARKVS